MATDPSDGYNAGLRLKKSTNFKSRLIRGYIFVKLGVNVGKMTSK